MRPGGRVIVVTGTDEERGDRIELLARSVKSANRTSSSMCVAFLEGLSMNRSTLNRLTRLQETVTPPLFRAHRVIRHND
jgi:hypothetical protein